MITQEFGVQTCPPGVSEDEWRLFNFGAGRGMGFLMRVNENVFQLRISSEMVNHYGTLEELISIFRRISVASGWHPEMEPIVHKVPISRKVAHKIAPKLDDIDDLLSGL